MSNNALSWIGPLSLGAALMYLLDPADGRRRRAIIRDKSVRLARETSEGAAGIATDLQNRAIGVASELRGQLDTGPVDDAVLAARVRSAIGRVCTHPGSIAVSSVEGIVELNGPVLAHEHDAVLRAVDTVRGVVEVITHMTQHESADSVPGLQGDGSLPTGAWSDGQWSSTRLLGVLGAAGLLAYGIKRRDVAGGLVAAAGAGLLARSFSDMQLPAIMSEAFEEGSRMLEESAAAYDDPSVVQRDDWAQV